MVKVKDVVIKNLTVPQRQMVRIKIERDNKFMKKSIVEKG